MIRLLTTLILVVLLSNASYAAITYDNGQHNYINTFINDDVWVLDNADSLPTTIEVQSNGNIFHSVWVYGSSGVILNGGSIGDADRDVHAYGSSHVEITSGIIGRFLNLHGNSTSIISGGSVHQTVSTHDNTTLTIYGGNIGGGDRELMVYGSSRVFFHNGTIGRNLNVSNDGFVDMTGGNISSNANLNNNASLVMSGGNIGQDLYAEDTSTVEISGGWIDRTLYARHDAEITIIGTSFNCPFGYITAACGTLTGTLANGDPIDVPFVREGNGSILLKDPELNITVNSPNGGERYLSNSPVDIEYTTQGDVAINLVDIEYSSDGGSSWNTIATGTSSTGIYEWATPDTESEACLVRVSVHGNPAITDVSDGVFTIFKCSALNRADLDGNCYVNLADLSLFAAEWLWCGDRYDPACDVQ